MTKERLSYLLDRLAENRIGREEYAELMEYIQQEGSEQALEDAIKQTPETLETDQTLGPVEAERLYRRISEDPRYKPVSYASKTPVRRRYFRWQIAAAIVLVIGLGIAAFYLRGLRSAQSDQVVYHEKSAPPGKRMRLELSDGTVVWLNAASRLRYPDDFGRASREISLEGEAYFEVTPGKPFVVHTGRVSTRVLGTAFNIQAYKPDHLSVTVASGKVGIYDGKQALGQLTINKRLEYNLESKEVKTMSADAAAISKWKDGELVFRDAGMQEAAEIIGRWYDVTIRFSNPGLKNCRFTASFLQGASLQKVMDIISELNGFDYDLQGKELIISGKGCG